jgi:hypothetical protein
MTALWRIYGGSSWLKCLIATVGRCGDYAKAIEGIEAVLESMPMLDFIYIFFFKILERPSRSIRPVGLQCVTWLVKEKMAPLDAQWGATYHYSILQCAAATGSVELVQHLLDLGADVNVVPSGEAMEDCNLYRPVTAIAVAACYDRAMVELLLRAGADPNLDTRYRKRSALWYALKGGRWATARLLVQHGARLGPWDHCE